jgi:hypothetical protein
VATARKNVVIKGMNAVYFLKVECVRGILFFDDDRATGKKGSHRRDWVYERMMFLCENFGIRIHTYDLMGNQYYLIAEVLAEKIEALEDDEVARRWFRVHPPRSYKKTGNAEVLEEEIRLLVKDKDRIKVLRERLCDISYFMKDLNENIARRVNAELSAKGKLWGPRFNCKRLLDERAIFMAMSFVDTNPSRTGRANSAEESRHNGCQDRIKAIQAQENIALLDQLSKKQPLTLEQEEDLLEMKLLETRGKNLSPISPTVKETALPISEPEYLKSLTWTESQTKPEKHGEMAAWHPPILDQLRIRKRFWPNSINLFESLFYCVVGGIPEMKQAASLTKKKWYKGLSSSNYAFLN